MNFLKALFGHTTLQQEGVNNGVVLVLGGVLILVAGVMLLNLVVRGVIGLF